MPGLVDDSHPSASQFSQGLVTGYGTVRTVHFLFGRDRAEGVLGASERFRVGTQFLGGGRRHGWIVCPGDGITRAARFRGNGGEEELLAKRFEKFGTAAAQFLQ